ncbi:SemiSWEET transporter [Candidatus Woesearchaeota archaeon]|nr:SemiSWEET transporter [Candidatus Woesearchaeota archaeon]
MNYVEILGFAAGICSTIAFLPQAIKTWKTKHTKDLSIGLFALITTGTFLWLVYGILINSLPLILANLFTFILASTILIFKLRYG